MHAVKGERSGIPLTEDGFVDVVFALGRVAPEGQVVQGFAARLGGEEVGEGVDGHGVVKGWVD